MPVYTADGQLYFNFVKPLAVALTGSIIVEDDATATGLESDWVAGTLKLMRMEFAGSATSGSGGTYSTKLLRIDIKAYINKVNTLESQDGNDTKKVDFTAVYSAADSALFASMTFVNSLTALV